VRICIKNPGHRRLGATRCEVPGCGALVVDLEEVTHQSRVPRERVDDPGATRRTGPAEAAADDGASRAQRTAAPPPGRPDPPGTPARVLIHHQTGSKANQTEQLPVDLENELTIGRDPNCTIIFDARRDDIVSRHHAVIRITRGERLGFAIADLGSANGTLINGTRINSEVELLPGDTVQLGVSGPVFDFDVQPRPPHLVARTRVVSGVLPTTTISES
jgi:hypothetical protein